MKQNWNKVKEGEELSTLAKIVVGHVGKSGESGEMLSELEGFIDNLLQQSRKEVVSLAEGYWRMIHNGKSIYYSTSDANKDISEFMKKLHSISK